MGGCVAIVVEKRVKERRALLYEESPSAFPVRPFYADVVVRVCGICKVFQFACDPLYPSAVVQLCRSLTIRSVSQPMKLMVPMVHRICNCQFACDAFLSRHIVVADCYNLIMTFIMIITRDRMIV